MQQIGTISETVDASANVSTTPDVTDRGLVHCGRPWDLHIRDCGSQDIAHHVSRALFVTSDTPRTTCVAESVRDKITL